MSQNDQQLKPDETQETIKPITTLLAKEVNRTEFLSIVGFGALTLVGLGPIIKFLTDKGSLNTKSSNRFRTEGFGSGPYGV